MFSSTMNPPEAGTDSGTAFQPVFLRTLQSNAVISFDLFIRNPPESGPTLYREASLPFVQEARERLVESKIDVLWVREADHANYHRYVEDHLSTILADKGLPLQQRSALLYRTTQTLVKELLESSACAKILQRGRRVVEHLTHLLASNTTAFSCLAQLATHSAATYAHCVDVCVFATALAHRLGFQEEKAMEISLGCLLHDVGKRQIDAALLHREGELSPEEQTVLRQHPIIGERILAENGIKSRIVLDIVRHHHENLAGNGYPDVLPAAAVRPWVRIASIANTFSALTAPRPPQKPLGSFQALQNMRDEMSDQFDRPYLREFIKLLAGR